MRAELSSGGLPALAEQAAQEEATKTARTPATGKQETEKRVESGNGLPSTLVFLGVGAAVVLLGGIAFAIMRDARAIAPVPEGGVASGGGSRSAEARLRKRRAQAKAARRQRKRNR